MDGTVSALHHYPIKGLSGQVLEHVALTAGQGFPNDRVFAFARSGTAFDEAAPKALPKTAFHMLAKDASLAALRTHYDATAQTLSIEGAGGRQTYAIDTPEGADAAAGAIAAALSLAKGDRPRLVRGAGHRFTDVSVVSPTFMNAVSLINLATVQDLGGRVGTPLDPVRFRGNVLFDGWPAWQELALEGRHIALGTARLKVLLRTERCAATTVNPATAKRDVFVPRLLRDFFGHADCGIYAEVVEDGIVRLGDPIRVLPQDA
ncbi:MAG: MOSC domain-containing protein [Pseudomonadota bacterium]